MFFYTFKVCSVKLTSKMSFVVINQINVKFKTQTISFRWYFLSILLSKDSLRVESSAHSRPTVWFRDSGWQNVPLRLLDLYLRLVRYAKNETSPSDTYRRKTISMSHLFRWFLSVWNYEAAHANQAHLYISQIIVHYLTH